ncbi:MAG TPA: NAD(P)-dependent oxidoreductase [Candidatus Limnocylindrales bacterium]
MSGPSRQLRSQQWWDNPANPERPLTPDTHHLFDDTTLARMKPTAILINTARGPIIEDAALDRALRKGAIAAALDDLEEEPAKQREWKPGNPLLQQSSAIVTPACRLLLRGIHPNDPDNRLAPQSTGSNSRSCSFVGCRLRKVRWLKKQAT